LGQPESFALLNDMVDQANHAYVGEMDPTTGEMGEGVTWIHEHLQSLATMTITQYFAGGSPPEIVPNTNTTTAFSTSVGARVVQWGRVGLYGRPLSTPYEVIK
jgi:hypothetical protein